MSIIGIIIAALAILFAIGYFLFPIDFLPDFIPILGYVDDLFVGLVSLVIMFLGIKK